MAKIPLKETIVVEGKYDKQKLSALFDTWVIAVGGFRVFRDRALLDTLRRAARQNGIILFMDADGAGLVIRNFLQGAIGDGTVRHAYTPQIPGCEKRKRVPGKAGLLGVEGISDEILIDCILRAAPQEATDVIVKNPVTRMDFYDLGLSGAPDSAAKRRCLLKHCGLPDYLSAGALLDAVQYLYGREEFFRLCAALFDATPPNTV